MRVGLSQGDLPDAAVRGAPGRAIVRTVHILYGRGVRLSVPEPVYLPGIRDASIITALVLSIRYTVQCTSTSFFFHNLRTYVHTAELDWSVDPELRPGELLAVCTMYQHWSFFSFLLHAIRK